MLDPIINSTEEYQAAKKVVKEYEDRYPDKSFYTPHLIPAPIKILDKECRIWEEKQQPLPEGTKVV
jgi:hypothetical protein